MEINIGMSECDKNVDNFYGRNFESPTAPAERLSTVSSPFMVLKIRNKIFLNQGWNLQDIFLLVVILQNECRLI